MSDLKNIVEQAKQFSIRIIMDYPDRMVYHDIKFAKRFVQHVTNIGEHVGFSEEDKQLSAIGAWLMSASFQDARITFGKDGRPHSNLPDEAMKTATLFFENSSLSKEHQQALEKALIESANPDVIPQTDLGKALADGSTADVLLGNGLKRVKKVYEEMLLKDVALSKKKWYDLVIGFISKYEFHLPYCKETYHPKMEQLLLELQKEKKRLEKSADLALKKELDISDDELKELKKNLKGSKGRDARGIQTMFRTTSKNHYTLNAVSYTHLTLPTTPYV